MERTNHVTREGNMKKSIWEEKHDKEHKDNPMQSCPYCIGLINLETVSPLMKKIEDKYKKDHPEVAK